jgi:hypothetical protein
MNVLSYKNISLKCLSTIGGLALVVGILGCATPSSRISLKLENLGMDKNRAECLGDYLSSHLTFRQMLDLDEAANNLKARVDSDQGERTKGLMRSLAAFSDPTLYPIFIRAGIACAFPS